MLTKYTFYSIQLQKVKETGSTDQTEHYILTVFAPELANN